VRKKGSGGDEGGECGKGFNNNDSNHHHHHYYYYHFVAAVVVVTIAISVTIIINGYDS